MTLHSQHEFMQSSSLSDSLHLIQQDLKVNTNPTSSKWSKLF